MYNSADCQHEIKTTKQTMYIGRKHAILLLESHSLGKMFFIMDLKTWIISLQLTGHNNFSSV